MKEIFPGVWKEDKRLMTRNLVPGFRSYTENLVKVNGIEYRVWDPNRSKLAAAVMKGIRNFPVEKGQKVLYLGAAQGYTPSFVSDIVGKEGVVYAVEFSQRTFQELNPVAEKRGNIVPILADARKPQDYSWIEPVDMVFQDVATPDQPEILIRNCKAFLKTGGLAAIAIKSRSIDVTKEPKEIYEKVFAILSSHFETLDRVELDPFELDHAFGVLRLSR